MLSLHRGDCNFAIFAVKRNENFHRDTPGFFAVPRVIFHRGESASRVVAEPR